MNNPVAYLDQRGDSTVLYATILPGSSPDGALREATHTFIAVTGSDGKYQNFAYGSEYDGVAGAFGGQLKEVSYNDDINSMNGKNNRHVKGRFPITPPSGMSVEDFDQNVMSIIRSFGNNPDISYFMLPYSETQGNCNTSTSTILHKAGIGDEEISDLASRLPGIAYGFGMYRPWTAVEQQAAVDRSIKGIIKNIAKSMLNFFNLSK